MKENLKMTLELITHPVTLMIILGIACLIRLAIVSNEIRERQDAETLRFIESCIKIPDRKVDTVGGPWTKQYIVCNPK